jgi:hypothetical protein
MQAVGSAESCGGLQLDAIRQAATTASLAGDRSNSIRGEDRMPHHTSPAVSGNAPWQAAMGHGFVLRFTRIDGCIVLVLSAKRRFAEHEPLNSLEMKH